MAGKKTCFNLVVRLPKLEVVSPNQTFRAFAKIGSGQPKPGLSRVCQNWKWSAQTRLVARLPKLEVVSKIRVSQMSLKDSNVDGEDENRVAERRLERNTFIFIAAISVAGGAWAGWRMLFGILIGSALSLFNKRWLRGSLQVMLDRSAAEGIGKVPSFTAFKFILRYVVIALVIGAAVRTGRVHPLGIGIGFAAIVGGAMIETVYQLYLGFKTNSNSSQE